MQYRCDADCDGWVVLLITNLENGDTMAACADHAAIFLAATAEGLGAAVDLARENAEAAPETSVEATNGTQATNGAGRPKRARKGRTEAAEAPTEAEEPAEAATDGG